MKKVQSFNRKGCEKDNPGIRNHLMKGCVKILLNWGGQQGVRISDSGKTSPARSGQKEKGWKGVQVDSVVVIRPSSCLMKVPQAAMAWETAGAIPPSSL